MKKIIAVLLSLSMISALAGCKKKSEETTKKTKKTKETEVTEIETEESETETEATSEDTEPSESESSSEPETKPGTGLKDFKLSTDFMIRNDQKNLDYEIVSTDRAFAAPTSDGRYGMIRKDAGKVQFSPAEIDAHNQLWNTLESQSAELNYVLDEQYDTLRPQLVSSVKDGSYSTDTYLYGDIWVYRADTDIFSYAICQDISSPSLTNTSLISHTYRASDGMEYFFEDVVTDRAGFADFFEKIFAMKTKKSNSSFRTMPFILLTPNLQIRISSRSRPCTPLIIWTFPSSALHLNTMHSKRISMTASPGISMVMVHWI